MGLWNGDDKGADAIRASRASSGKKGRRSKGSGWTDSFDAFVKNVAGPEVAFDWD